MATTTRPAPRRVRLLVAFCCAVAAGLYTYRYSVVRLAFGNPRYSDFGNLWYSAGALLRGANPYANIGPGQAFDYSNAQVYPITGILLATPFAGLPLAIADGVFAAIGVALLSYAITASGWYRLPVLLSFPLITALQGVQWSPALTAAAVMPGLAWMLAAKPTIGAALAAYDPSWPRLRVLLIGGGLLTISGFGLAPGWVGDWLASLRTPAVWQTGDTAGGMLRLYQAPVTCLGGPLILLALLRWRRPEARLTVALASVPQTMLGYELVPLLALVPETRRQSLLLVVLSWGLARMHELAPARDLVTVSRVVGTASVWLVFLPIVALLLRRPNEGAVPLWMEARLARSRFPDWLRGRPATHARGASVEAPRTTA